MIGHYVVLCFFFGVVQCLPEQGQWKITLNNKERMIFVTKSLYNQSTVALKIECKSDVPNFKVQVQWVMRWTPCEDEYTSMSNSEANIETYFMNPESDLIGFNPGTIYYFKSDVYVGDCYGGHNVIVLLDDTDKEWSHSTPIQNVTKTAPESESAAQSRKKRQSPENGAPDEAAKADATPTAPKAPGPSKQPSDNINDNEHKVAKVPRDGSYLFIMTVNSNDVEGMENKFNATVTIKMEGPHGSLSAVEWPLLPFYGAMCIVYILYGLVWLVLIMCNWRDLLRLQFWIGGVIFLGMLEKAVFFAEYESLNSTGIPVKGAMVFAEIVSCAKRSLARMLVIIVSLGFGIVKPRLGPMLHRVLGMGVLYFILASVEACLRILKPRTDPTRQSLLAGIPLAVIDATLCWWIFTGLVATTRTLRLRRNLVKLSLYRHFTNTLIFAVLASIAFMIWSIKEHKFARCLTDWKEMWVDDAFWHLLFSIILLVIMILWRPTINNQRYAFSPLLDAADDEEEEEPMITDAYEGMKMRGKGQNGGHSPKDSKSKAEEDLKWIEENIPATVSDTALPSLLDSDEEIMTTRFELSKME